MTSRQPGTTPSGTMRAPRGPGTRGRADNPGHNRTPGGAAAQPWPLVLPVALLIILGLAGLRGAVTRPEWNGPLYRDVVVIGLALEVVLGVLLVITIRRRSVGLRVGTASAVAVKLRGVLIFALSTGMVAVVAAIVIGLHLHLARPEQRAPPSRAGAPRSAPLRRFPPGSHSQVTVHIPVAALLYALLIVMLVVGVLLSVWWSRRFRLPGDTGPGDFVAEDPEDLREAVESGRSALRTVDDARAAIIACYVAMENSLAERGTARAVADTPDELLARATRSGVVRGTAAARLTALFYEARFSSHPLDRSQRDAAEQALDELARTLAKTAPAEAEAGRAPGAGA